MAPFELWSSDLFDRESAPSLEGTWTGADSALEALWRHVLDEGVQDDGRPTFTDFQLRTPGQRAVFIPRDPLDNPELALLRRLRGGAGFLGALASVHEARLERPFDFEPFLALAPDPPPGVVRVVDALRAALSISGALARHRTVWRAGSSDGPHVGVASSVIGGTTRWWARLAAVEFEGKPVSFGVAYSERDGSWTVESDDSPATLPLRDALLSVGL